MEIIKFKPPLAETFRAKAIAVGLVVSGLASACGGQISAGSYQQRILGEIKDTTPLTEGDQRVDRVVVDGVSERHDQELEANGGVNVRTFPGIDGRVIGKVAQG